MPRNARCLRALLACIAISFAFAANADPETSGIAKPAKPSFLLVTFDTARADRFGAYGYAKATTPNFDGLANRGVVFDSAHAPTPITLPSHASMLTGTYPSAHGVYDNIGFALADEAILVSEVFRRSGWRSAAFVGSYVLDSSMGLDQGFEVYRDPGEDPATRTQASRRPAAEVVSDAIAWLSTVDPSEPFFAWVHFYDPHQPLPRTDSLGHALEDPYQDAIDDCDRELGRLLKFVTKRGLSKNMVTVATADHGEANGEHRERTHGLFLYRGVMRVPLVVSGDLAPEWRGVRVERPVTTASIAPTLLSLAGVPARELPDVRLPSLLLDGGREPASNPVDPLYLQTFLPYYSFQWRGLEGIVWNGHKLIRGSRPELYSLADDPEEIHDLAEAQPSRVAEMDEQLSKLLSEHPPLGWTDNRAVAHGEQQLLQSLGYVTGTEGNDPLDASLPDPRDKVGEMEAYDQMEEALAHWFEAKRRYESAWQRDQAGRKYLEQAQAHSLALRHSKVRPILHARGVVEHELGNYSEAARVFEELIALVPGEPTPHRKLANALWKANQRDAATRALKTAISLDPMRPAYYQDLIQWHLESGNPERAADWMVRYPASMKPGSPQHIQAVKWVDDRRRQISPTQTDD